MITAYALNNDRLEPVPLEAGGTPPPSALWIDLLSPTREEDQAVERATGIAIPTREEMQEIEVSSRLYREGEAHFMTAPIIHHTNSPRPEVTPVTFILTPAKMLTVHYATPKSIDFFIARVARQAGWFNKPETMLIGLMETIVDRVADVMERVAGELDALSRQVFYDPAGTEGEGQNGPQSGEKLRAVMRQIGRSGDLTSKTRDTILGLDRVATYLMAAGTLGTGADITARLKTLTRDLRSLAEHDAFLSNKVNFLLDATLGLISIEQNKVVHDQNNIIKIFTVAATVFLPPTLVASIYGMNFKFMPELDEVWGYPFAVVMMVISALLPIWYFRRRGWL